MMCDFVISGEKMEIKLKMADFLLGLGHDSKRQTLFVKLNNTDLHALRQTKGMGPVVVLVPGALVGLFVVSLPAGGLDVYPQCSLWHQPVPRGEKKQTDDATLGLW